MVAIAVAGSHAFVANIPGDGNPAQIIHCNIGTSGSLSECANTGPANLEGPYGLTIHGSTLYISSFDTPRVLKCGIKADGSLDACMNAGLPDDLALSAEDLRIAGSTAYVVHFDESMVSRCDVLADGTLAN